MNGTGPEREPEVLDVGHEHRARTGPGPARRLPGWLADSRLARFVRVRAGRRGRRPDVLWLVIAVLVAVVIIQALSRPAAAHHPAASQDHSRDAPVLTAVIAQAALPGPLRDMVRPRTAAGTCRQAQSDYSPQRAAASALATVLPRLHVAEAGRTFDQAAALCSVLVRARDGHGTTLIIEVIAPVEPVTDQTLWLTSAVQVDGTTQTKYVSATSATGWTVHVGVTGPVQGQPAADQLFMVALDPVLTW